MVQCNCSLRESRICNLAQYKIWQCTKLQLIHSILFRYCMYWGVQCNLARYKRPNWKEANAGGFEDWKQIGPVNCNKPLNYIGAPWEKYLKFAQCDQSASGNNDWASQLCNVSDMCFVCNICAICLIPAMCAMCACQWTRDWFSQL